MGSVVTSSDMGGSQSLPLEAVEGFTPEEVARLHKRFRKLDKDSNESLCVEEFLALPELKENPLVQRVVSVFDTNNSGELDFTEFVRVSPCSPPRMWTGRKNSDFCSAS